MKVTLAAMDQGGTGLSVYANHLYRYLSELHDDVDFMEDRAIEISLFGKSVGGYVSRILSNLYGSIPGDVVHATDILTLHKKADIVTLHDTYIFDHPSHYGVGGSWWRWWVRRAKKCRYVIANSEYTKRCAMKHLDLDPDKVRVTPLAARDGIGRLDIETYHPSITVLFVGSIKTTKNTLNMVKALSLLAERSIKPIEILHAGPSLSEDDPYHRQVASEIIRSDNLIYREYGYVELPTLNILYNIVDCLGFASMDEGFGLPALEALKVGTPVVTSDHPVFSETVGNKSHKAGWDDITGLCYAFSDAIHDSQSSSLIARAERLSWENTAKLTLDVYKEVVE